MYCGCAWVNSSKTIKESFVRKKLPWYLIPFRNIDDLALLPQIEKNTKTSWGCHSNLEMFQHRGVPRCASTLGTPQHVAWVPTKVSTLSIGHVVGRILKIERYPLWICRYGCFTFNPLGNIPQPVQEKWLLCWGDPLPRMPESENSLIMIV